MGASLREQRRVRDDAFRGVNRFSSGRRVHREVGLDGTGGIRTG